MTAPLQVKGFAWLNLLACVREKLGADTLVGLTAAFPQHATFFEEATVLPVGWVPGELHCGAIEWLVKSRHAGSTVGAQEIGTLLASRNLAGTFRSLSRMEDLRTALASTQRAFSQFYSRGTMVFTVKDVLLEARLSDFPAASETMGHCLGAGLVAFLKAGHLDARLERVVVGPDSIGYDVRLR
ncbi:MAG: hypothetical protein Q8L14_42225 [Myxococcales bacterium]|nr:hypothetical protein [Myxococcales bacterium]